MKIGVVSLGLIGGSLLKALHFNGFQTVGITQNKTTLENAQKYSDFCSKDISLLKDCNIVFVCAPIANTLKILDELECIVSKNTIVTDVASVKKFVMQKKYSYKFIGSHPMAGTEKSGFQYSDENLFKNARWVLTPPPNVDSRDVRVLADIIEKLGAKTILTDAQTHDEAVALISHLPMLIAQTLFASAMDNDLALQLAASGFRDTTRLAMTNNDLASDMMTYNASNIATAAEKFVKILNKFQNENYKNLISEITEKREKLYSAEGKNIYKL